MTSYTHDMRYPWYSRSCHSTLGEHPYPSHSLPESVDMLVCWVALSLYLCSPICLSVCILWYDVYNAALACIVYSYSCPLIACVHTSTLILLHVFAPSPSLCMLPHTYTHTMYVHLCTIQYTLHTIHGILPPLTRIHVRSNPHILYTCP